MRVLIVLAHPEPASFNAALAARGSEALRKAGHEVEISDLHRDRFNPIAGPHDFTKRLNAERFNYQIEQAHAVRISGFSAEIAREQARVARADMLVLQFPLWWGGVPAVMKGWFDRVLAYGFAYADGLRYEKGVFRGRRAMVSVTSGGLQERFGPGAVYGDLTAQVLWQVQHTTLAYMGYDVAPPFIAYGASRVSDAARADYLNTFAEQLLAAAALPVDRSLGIGDPLAEVPDAAITRNK